MDEDELRDYMDQDPGIPPTSTTDFRPYARFLQMPDYSDMTQEEFTKAVVSVWTRFHVRVRDLHPGHFDSPSDSGKLYTPI